MKFSTKLTTKDLQLTEGNIKRKILPWQESKKSSVTICLSLENKKQEAEKDQRLLIELNKQGKDVRGIIIRKTKQVNQATLAKALKWLEYQE